MRVLMVHNYYAMHGGEDTSTGQEIQLLREFGHDVETYTRHNNEIEAFSTQQKARLFLETTRSARTYQDIQQRLRHFKPDIVHVQNFFPLVSPAVFYACADAHVPVVMSLRNYRLLCPSANFFRDGHICEDCLTHRSLWPSLVHRCYRDSLPQTAAVVWMLHQHRRQRTWTDKVNAYISLTEFAKQKLVQGGLPADRIYVRPNFLSPDPGLGAAERTYAIFVGRLAPEKGALTLVEAWQHLPHIPLKLVGDGPVRGEIAAKVDALGLDHIEIVGFAPPAEVLSLIKGASLLIMPSEWYETFGRTIMEAFATGTPVLASRLGAMAELVTDNQDGKLFTFGDAADLARQAADLYANLARLQELGQNGRLKFERCYSAEVAHQSISAIYQEVIQNHRAYPISAAP